MEWVDVDKKLPKEDQFVLIFPCGLKRDGLIHEAFFERGEFWDFREAHNCCRTLVRILGITHWMAMPKKPKF